MNNMEYLDKKENYNYTYTLYTTLQHEAYFSQYAKMFSLRDAFKKTSEKCLKVAISYNRYKCYKFYKRFKHFKHFKHFKCFEHYKGYKCL